jgi:hypothetical protein
VRRGLIASSDTDQGVVVLLVAPMSLLAGDRHRVARLGSSIRRPWSTSEWLLVAMGAIMAAILMACRTVGSLHGTEGVNTLIVCP